MDGLKVWILVLLVGAAAVSLSQGARRTLGVGENDAICAAPGMSCVLSEAIARQWGS